MVTWEDKWPNSAFPLPSFFHQLLLQSTTPCTVGNPFGQFRSAVQTVFPPRGVLQGVLLLHSELYIYIYL